MDDDEKEKNKTYYLMADYEISQHVERYISSYVLLFELTANSGFQLFESL